MVICIVGNYIVGRIADKMVAGGRTNARPLVAGVIQLFNATLFLVAFGFTGGNLQFFLLLLGGVSMASFNGPSYSAITELVHPGLRSTAISVLTLLQNVLGFAMGPVVAGMISDKFGISAAMIVLAFSPAVAAIFFLLAGTTYNRDLEKTEKVQLSLEDNKPLGVVTQTPAATGETM